MTLLNFLTWYKEMDKVPVSVGVVTMASANAATYHRFLRTLLWLFATIDADNGQCLIGEHN